MRLDYYSFCKKENVGKRDTHTVVSYLIGLSTALPSLLNLTFILSCVPPVFSSEKIIITIYVQINTLKSFRDEKLLILSNILVVTLKFSYSFI